jgi:hypothetical protein
VIRFALALVAVLACCVPVEATDRGVRVRATPLRRGPVVIVDRGFHSSRNFDRRFDSRDFHGARNFRGPVIIDRGFHGGGARVFRDQFGRTFIVP